MYTNGLLFFNNTNGLFNPVGEQEDGLVDVRHGRGLVE